MRGLDLKAEHTPLSRMPLHVAVDVIGRMMISLIHEMTDGPMDDNRRANCRALHQGLRNCLHHAAGHWANGELTVDDREVLVELDRVLENMAALLRQIVADQRAS